MIIQNVDELEKIFKYTDLATTFPGQTLHFLLINTTSDTWQKDLAKQVASTKPDDILISALSAPNEEGTRLILLSCKSKDIDSNFNIAVNNFFAQDEDIDDELLEASCTEARKKDAKSFPWIFFWLIGNSLQSSHLEYVNVAEPYQRKGLFKSIFLGFATHLKNKSNEEHAITGLTVHLATRKIFAWGELEVEGKIDPSKPIVTKMGNREEEDFGKSTCSELLLKHKGFLLDKQPQPMKHCNETNISLQQNALTLFPKKTITKKKPSKKTQKPNETIKPYIKK